MEPQHPDFNYFDLIKEVLYEGVEKEDRTGTGTTSKPFIQHKFSLRNGKIPLLTTKQMFIRGILYELLWYICGDTNIKYLNDHHVHIWDQWADENGDLGPVYGAQWRRWTGVTDEGEIKTIDQLTDVIEKLKTDPTNRRIIISTWNVTQLPDMKLPPCHCLVQFWSDGKELRSHLYQRSCDVGLGVPFNWVQYSILTHMIGRVTGLEPVEFAWTGGDVHIYNNHKKSLVQQLVRDPYPSPTLILDEQPTDNIEDFTYDGFEIINYQYHPPIKLEVSV